VLALRQHTEPPSTDSITASARGPTVVSGSPPGCSRFRSMITPVSAICHLPSTLRAHPDSGHAVRLRRRDLRDLRWHWGRAYEISWDGQFRASRRDDLGSWPPAPRRTCGSSYGRLHRAPRAPRRPGPSRRCARRRDQSGGRWPTSRGG
jgi:hypothetical protein